MADVITLDELLELCAVVGDEPVSPDNLLLNVFWDPDQADGAIDAIKGHARECDEPRRGQLFRLIGLIEFARTLGALQRKHLIALYPPAEALYSYGTWLLRALDAARMRGGDAPPLFPLAEELTRKLNTTAEGTNVDRPNVAQH